MDAADELGFSPTKKTASPDSFRAGCLQVVFSREKLTAGIRYGRRVQQQLLPVLAQVDSGALRGIRC